MKPENALSISQTLNIRLLTSVILSAFIALLIGIVINQYRTERDLDGRRQEYAAALIDVLKLPLWNLDVPMVKAIGMSYSKNDWITYIVIEQYDGTVIYTYAPAGIPKGANAFDVLFEDDYVGRIILKLSAEYYETAGLYFLIIYLIGVSVVSLSISFVSHFLLNHYLKAPLQNVERAVLGYLQGDVYSFDQRSDYIEFKSLFHTLEYMSKRISSQMDELKLSQFVVDNSAVGILLVRLTDSSIVMANDWMSRALQVKKEDLLNTLISQYCRDWPFSTLGHREEQGQKKDWISECLFSRKDETTFYSEVVVSKTKRKEEDLLFVFVQDITDKKKTEALLEEILKAVPVPIALGNEGNRVIKTNDAFVNQFGYTLKDIPTVAHWFKLAYPDAEYRQRVRVDWSSRVTDYQKSGKFREQEVLVYCKDSRKKNIVIDYVNLEDIQIVSFMDISKIRESEKKLKQNLRERELLLQEIHHRVKNNLQVIASLINLQTSFLSDTETINHLHNTASRVDAMGILHNKLYQSRDFSQIDMEEYLLTIIAQIQNVHSELNNNIRIKSEIGHIHLGIDEAMPCGLIVNEIVNNSLKYAFPNNAAGTITIGLDFKDRLYRLSVKDDGIGIPDTVNFQNNTGLGLTLIESLSTQLGGATQIIREEGTAFLIEFPAP